MTGTLAPHRRRGPAGAGQTVTQVRSGDAAGYNALMTTTAAPRQANAQNQYTVTPADLPLSCPMPDMTLWNSHPRVYLPIEASGWAKCPYCGAEYTLKR